MIGLSSFVRYHAVRTPDRPALSFGGETISYGQFLDRIEGVAGWLATRKIDPGDIVAVLMKNSPAFLDLAFAASHLGAVFLPINFRLSAEEVGYISNHAGAKLIIVDEELAGSAPSNIPCVVLST